MRTHHPGQTLLMACLVALGATLPAQAQSSLDLSGAYDGTLVLEKPVPRSTDVAGTLAQSGKVASGSLAVNFADVNTGGAYNVVGTVRVGRRTTRLRLKGSNMHATATFKGTVAADGALTLKTRIKPPAGSRLVGVLTLSRRAGNGGGGGTGCDGVYNANQLFFDQQVMATVLVPICAQCHVAGGLAGATRLRVTPADPLATSRSVAALVDLAAPAASRLLQKPTVQVAHGGGLQLTSGSPQELTLHQWVDLIAAAQCDAGGGTGCGSGGTGAQLFAQNCASCHGDDARGLAGRPDVHCNRAIHDVVRNGRTGAIGEMPAFACLNDQDLSNVQAFLNDLCIDPTGEELFVGNCQSCHGAGGVGQAPAPNLQCAVRSRVFDAVRNGRGPLDAAMPAFLPTLLTDVEAARVVGWLQASCDGQPANAYRSNCVTCHGPTGQGATNADGIHGPDIPCQSTNDFREKVHLGSDAMPPFPEFTTPQIDAIAAYMHPYCIP